MAKKAASKKPAAKKPAAKKPAAKPAKKANPDEPKNYFLHRFAKSLALGIADSEVTSADENGPSTKAYKKRVKELREKCANVTTFDELVETLEPESEVVQTSLNAFFDSLKPGGRERRASEE